MLALAQGLSPFLLFFISHIALLQAIAIASILRPSSPPPSPPYPSISLPVSKTVSVATKQHQYLCLAVCYVDLRFLFDFNFQLSKMVCVYWRTSRPPFPISLRPFTALISDQKAREKFVSLSKDTIWTISGQAVRILYVLSRARFICVWVYVVPHRICVGRYRGWLADVQVFRARRLIVVKHASLLMTDPFRKRKIYTSKILLVVCTEKSGRSGKGTITYNRAFSFFFLILFSFNNKSEINVADGVWKQLLWIERRQLYL